MNLKQSVAAVCLTGPKVLNGIAPTQAALDKLIEAQVLRDTFRRMALLARQYHMELTMPRALVPKLLTDKELEAELKEVKSIRMHIDKAQIDNMLAIQYFTGDPDLKQHVEIIDGKQYLTVQRGKHRRRDDVEFRKKMGDYYLTPIKNLKLED